MFILRGFWRNELFTKTVSSKHRRGKLDLGNINRLSWSNQWHKTSWSIFVNINIFNHVTWNNADKCLKIAPRLFFNCQQLRLNIEIIWPNSHPFFLLIHNHFFQYVNLYIWQAQPQLLPKLGWVSFNFVPPQYDCMMKAKKVWES